MRAPPLPPRSRWRAGRLPPVRPSGSGWTRWRRNRPAPWAPSPAAAMYSGTRSPPCAPRAARTAWTGRRRARRARPPPSRESRRNRQEKLRPQPGQDRVHAFAGLQIREDERPRPPLTPGVSIHDGEIGAHVGREVDLVDDEQVGACDPGAALARDLLALGDIDDVDGGVHQLGAERGGKVVAAALDEEQVQRGKRLHEGAHRLQVHGGVFANGRVRTAARLHPHHALGRKGAPPHEELGVLLRIDVVGDDRHVEALAQAQAQRLREGRLAGADGSADADLQGTGQARKAGDGHERNNLLSRLAWRMPAISSPGLKLHMSSGPLAAAAAAARRAMRARWAPSTRWPSTWPSETSLRAAFTSSAAVECR